MTIKEELLELNTTKQGIKEVFEEKGVDLTNKKFSDTPSLIEQMNTGKGDEVEVFAVGAAKEAAADDKVILNYAADMLPEEQVVTDSKFYEWSDRNNYLYLVYCDKKRIYMTGWLDASTLGCPQYFERQEDGTYLHVGQITLRHNGRWYPVPFSLMANYDNSATDLYSFNKTSSTYYGSYARQRGCLTFSSDFQYASSGGFKNYLFKRVEENWVSLTNWESTNDDGYGIIGDRLILFRSGKLNTYSFDEGNFDIVGTTTTTDFSNGYMQYWRLFSENSKVIVKNTGAGSSDNSASVFHIANITFDGTLYSISKDVELTTLLQGYITDAGITGVYNIMIVGDKDIYVWGAGGIVAIRYENGTLTSIATPFPDLAWTGAFFINPVDKMAILQTDPKTCYVRYLDAPVAQKYVATAAGDGLQFQSVSLTGFVKENNNGILKVSTVLDPNATVPSYPDTYGLNVTVHPGGTDEQLFDIVGSPEIIDKVASNFSDSNYLTFKSPFKTEMQSFEVISCFNSTNVTVSNAGLYDGDSTRAEQMIRFTVTSDSKIKFRANSDVSSNTYLVDLTGTTTLLENTKYWAKATYDHEEGYKLFLSTNGSDYTQEASASTTALMAIANQADIIIGDNVATGSSFQGNIFLEECYINIDGQRVWSGYGFKEGSIDISWGWYKDGADYVKWPGTPAATLSNVEGEKATTMKLYLTQDGTETVPVLTQGELSPRPTFGTRLGGKATVVGEYTDKEGHRYVFAVLDAQYRKQDLMWYDKDVTGIWPPPDTGLENYGQDIYSPMVNESATYNTNYILNNYNPDSYPAFREARNAAIVEINGVEYKSQLPNIYELYKIWEKRNELDAFDPTLSAYPDNSLVKWGYDGDSDLDVWSSNEKTHYIAGTIRSDGNLNYYRSKNSDLAVFPIFEIPIEVFDDSSFDRKAHLVKEPIYLSDTLDYFLPDSYGLEPSIQYGYDEMTFEMPTLTANGTMGGDSPACAASSTEGSYYAWKAFDKNASTYWGSSSSAVPDWLTFYNPKALLVTQVDFVFTSEYYAAGTIQGSNDNKQWDDIGSFSANTSTALSVTCTTDTPYKYIRAYFTAVGNPWGKVISMDIVATVLPEAGSVTITQGWQMYNNVKYLLSNTKTKEFADVIIGEKATTMYLWLTKTGTATDFVVSVNAPSGVESSYQVMPVYLSAALDKFVEEAETVIADS